MTMDALDFRLLERAATPTGERGRFAVRIPPGLFAFDGHFPGDPVLPGVAQLLTLVLDRVHVLWPDLDQPRRVTRLKFRQKIGPGDALELHLDLHRHPPVTEVRFELHRGPDLCTQGCLDFSPVAAPPAPAQ